VSVKTREGMRGLNVSICGSFSCGNPNLSLDLKLERVSLSNCTHNGVSCSDPCVYKLSY